MIRAIETNYAGCRFRSRLEARWAVFFDALGISWEYEPEGFELNDGTRYLPDFYLPQTQTWVEVKPNAAAFDSSLIPLLIDLPGMRDSLWTPRGLVVATEFPDPRKPVRPWAVLQHCDSSAISERLDGLVWAAFFFFLTGEADGHASFAPRDTIERFFASVDDYQREFPFLHSLRPEFDPRSAYAAARSARFEHGQSG